MFGHRRRDAIASAWEIHRAHADWTGKVDAKAAFAFGVQSAIIAAVVALVAAGRLNVGGWWLIPLLLGLVLLAAGTVTSAVVVAPVLRSPGLREEANRDHIYFGHVRHVTGRDLERRLLNDDLLPVLSRQLIRMADIAWKKHIRVRWAIWLGVSGGLLVAATALASALFAP